MHLMQLRAYCLLLCFYLALASAALGQVHRYSFSSYSVAERFDKPAATPRLVPGTAAWQFRTRIREAAVGKPNFAGHYRLAQWGCGAECMSSAIIDLQTGKVYFIDFTTCCWYSAAATEPTPDVEPIDFRLTSRLVVFTGLLNEAGRNGPHSFKLEHGCLIALPY